MAPDRGSVGVYERPDRRRLIWIAAALAVAAAGAAVSVLWWLT